MFILKITSIASVIVCIRACEPSMTTVSGSHKPEKICSRKLIFQDHFEEFDNSVWQHEKTLAGGGNGEFQWYVNSTDNSFTKKGNLHIKPRLTADYFGDDFLTKGKVEIPIMDCTNSDNWGCRRQGTADNIINPVRSARIRTIKSFSFKFGTLVARAKMPAGDWLWPAIWLLPTQNIYGGWPRSGEIDLVESRGNRKLFDGNVNVGTEQVGSTLHFGPRADLNGWPTAHFVKNAVPSFSDEFHIYKLVWTPKYLEFYLDEKKVGRIDASHQSFWERGGFNSSGLPNPWAGRLPIAPFDQEFHILINLAVGGTSGYFWDGFRNENAPKPWNNSSPTAMKDFWDNRADWLSTWHKPKKNDDADLQVDYVRVYAL